MKADKDDLKQLRAHRKIDYYEDFSDGDQDDYVNDNREIIGKFPRKHKRATKEKDKEEEEGEKEANGKKKAKVMAMGMVNEGRLFDVKEESSPLKNNQLNQGNNGHSKQYTLSEVIIDLSDLNSKAVVTNSEIMLCLLEICLNSQRYDISLDNSSRNFWEVISQKNDLFHSLRHFKPETLRKYWRRMRLTYKYKKLIDTIRSSAEKINDTNFKLLSAINAVCDYVLNPGRGLDHYIQKYSSKKTKKSTNAAILIAVNNETDNDEDSNEDLNNKMDTIEEMVELLAKCFQNETKAFLYQKLIEVNGNVENAYLYIKDPTQYSYFAFTKEEDELIKRNDEDSEEYKVLLRKKGYLLINQRYKFLSA